MARRKVETEQPHNPPPAVFPPAARNEQAMACTNCKCRFSTNAAKQDADGDWICPSCGQSDATWMAITDVCPDCGEGQFMAVIDEHGDTGAMCFNGHQKPGISREGYAALQAVRTPPTTTAPTPSTDRSVPAQAPTPPPAPPRAPTPTPAEAAPTKIKEEPLYASANPSVRAQLDPDYAYVVESIYKVDIRREYEELKAQLTLGPNRGDPGHLLLALDAGEDNARRAHQLFLCAKLEAERYEKESDAIVGAMRDKAQLDLNAEKADGERRKAITNGDVDTRAAMLFPDEWADIHTRRAKAKGSAEHLKTLAELWQGRCATVRNINDTRRR